MNMQARMDAFDWAGTALGKRDGWPQSLQTAVGICMMSRLPMFVWWGQELINIYNDAYAPVLGKRHPGALGMPAREIWADIWPDIGDDVQAVVERGEAVSYNRQRLILERNGFPEETYFNYSHSPIPDGRGGIGGLFQVCQDETAAVLAERANEQMIRTLEVERRNLAAVVDDAPAFIVILRGADHRIERANERYFELIGGREVVGKTVAEALPELVSQGFVELLDKVYATGETFFGTEIPVMLGPEGAQHQHYLNFIYKLLRGVDGQASGVFVHGVDVTHDVNTRATLAMSERQRRLALDAADLGSWHINAVTLELTGDKRFARIFDLPTHTFTFDDAIAVIHEDDRERVRAAIAAAMASVDAPPYVAEYRVVHRDGTTHWVLGQGRLNALDESSTAVLSLDGTVADITERKHREVEREVLLAAERSARSEAEMQGRIKDEFLATLSHEIRTPLNAILGWSQVLQLTTNPADFGKGLEVIERNARAQAQIVEDLLDMSSIISGKVRLNVQRLNLTDIVTSAVETARPTADAKRVRLESVIDSLTGVETSGDANRMQQVLWNLLGNAIKFTPKGGKVQVLLERVNSHLEISVIDTGECISPEFLPFVFDRFRQADASTTRRHGGLGIGLSIVRQLVELHGGSVRSRSAGLGHGATFIVSLPLLAASSTNSADERNHPRVSRTTQRMSEPTSALAGVRVLVIDDEADARALVKRVLEHHGASVTALHSVDEVVAQVQQGQVDVLVSDIGMPGEDGYALIKRVRQLGRAQHGNIPAIALTAYARAEDRVRAVSAGFQMHVAKPVEPIELVTMVASAAGRSLNAPDHLE